MERSTRLRTILAGSLVLLLSAMIGCASDDVGCTAAALSMIRLQDKLDFTGNWAHVATLTEVESELEVAVGAETASRVVSWEVQEDFIHTREEPILAFVVDRHASVGTTNEGSQCILPEQPDWWDRTHFRVDWSQELAGTGIPGATEDWLAESVVPFVDDSDGDSFLPEFLFAGDGTGRLQTFVLPGQYFVRPCAECEHSVVRVTHRFERLD